MTTVTVIRSLLFTPGDHARRVEKALASDADAVILDLEDAVAVEAKVAARGAVASALFAERRPRAYVRINALSTRWAAGDLQAIVGPGLDGVVVPKVEGPDELFAAEWLIESLERDRGLAAGSIDTIALIETARGLSALRETLRAARRTRRVAFGAGDFTNDLGLEWTSGEAELAPYRAQIVAESRAAGLEAPIDTVWVRLEESDAFEASVRTAKALGFQGKLCIHPTQLAAVNAAFAPTAEELRYAQAVVEAFKEAETQGLAAIRVEGRFVDYPIRQAAERLIARAALIRERAS